MAGTSVRRLTGPVHVHLANSHLSLDEHPLATNASGARGVPIRWEG